MTMVMSVTKNLRAADTLPFFIPLMLGAGPSPVASCTAAGYVGVNPSPPLIPALSGIVSMFRTGRGELIAARAGMPVAVGAAVKTWVRSAAIFVPPLPSARSVPMPCFNPFFTSHQLTGYASAAPTSEANDMTPQKRKEFGSIARMSFVIRIIITGIIPAITAFIESHSGTHVPLTACQ